MHPRIQVPLPGLQAKMPADAVRRFENEFGCEPAWLAWAPGRVNLIGEHTDYNEGYVFPAAISLGTWVLACPAEHETRVVSMEEGHGASFQARTVAPGQVEGWSRYVAGVAWAMGGAMEIHALTGTDLPIGAGLSSSAALETAFARLWDSLDGGMRDDLEIALACQKAEHGMVGVQCGVMDQMASIMGKAGCALFMDVRSLTVEYVPLPAGLSIAICDTGMPRTLAESVYNERRRECEEACSALGVRSLREVDSKMTNLGSLEQIPGLRASHVVTENDRCREMATALRDLNRERIGELMRDSHLSLRNNYAVTTVELDEMARAAQESQGCWGARMTGAGMGGACVALVETEHVEQFSDDVLRKYRASTGQRSGSIRMVSVSNGAASGAWSQPKTPSRIASKNTGS